MTALLTRAFMLVNVVMLCLTTLASAKKDLAGKTAAINVLMAIVATTAV